MTSNRHKNECYKILDENTNVVFFKLNYLGDKNDILNSLEGEETHRNFNSDHMIDRLWFTFGNHYFRKKRFDMVIGGKVRFDGSIKYGWSTKYRDCKSVNKDEILIKKSKYSVSTFKKLYNDVLRYYPNEAKKILKFYRSLAGFEVNLYSKILVFKRKHDTLNILYKNNFININLPDINYEGKRIKSRYNLDFSPKDLKIKL